MIIEEDVEDFLEHYGVKGMKWGVRKDRVSGADRRIARAEVNDVRKSARSAIKQHRRAGSNAERAAAQKKYQKDVLDRIKSKEFKENYKKANTMSKGEMAAQAVLLGPMALVTIPATRAGYSQRQKYGAAQELATAREILKEMKS